uniref:Uncharacterized protein n=1 Tax=Ditylenchus dipsaci TaxID=166011 RepID=A0A915EQY3_9BILA
MPFPRYSLIFLHIYIRNSTVLTSPNLQKICGPEVGIKKGSLAGTPLLSLPVLQQCRELRLFVVKMDWTYGNVLKTNAMFTVDEIISWLHYTNTPTEIDKNEAGKKFTAERKLDLDRSSFNGFLVRDIIDKAAQIFLNDRRRHSYSLTFLDFNGPAIYLEI